MTRHLPGCNPARRSTSVSAVPTTPESGIDPALTPPAPTRKRGLTRRTAAAAIRRVDAMFSRNGPAFRRLAMSWAGNVAGDALVAVALAGTLFFDVPSTEARDKVLLYLVLTLAPFAIVAPVLGTIFAKFPIYRVALTLSAILRAVLAVIMTMGLTNLWLFPLAFGVLVLSRFYGISKSSLLPVALPQPVQLVSANAFLARIGIYAGALAVPIGAAAAQIPRMKGAAALILAAGCYIFAAVTSRGLPNAKLMQEATGELELIDPVAARRRRSPGRMRALRLSRYATAGVRLLNGFLLALLAFEFRESDAGFLDFGALIAATGLGFGLASFVSPFLERRLREEPMVVAALAIEAAAAFIAGQFFGIWAAAALVGAAGLAWGTAKFAFDGLLQQVVDPTKRGMAFTRSETLFQLAWVIGAIVPVAISALGAEVGLAIAGVTALTAQTLFVSSLLVDPQEEPKTEASGRG